MKIHYAVMLLLGLVLFGQAEAQTKKIVVLGSSTAFGAGASSPDSAWVARVDTFYNQNRTDGLDTLVINLAIGGLTTYDVMPDGFVPPGPPIHNRPNPDLTHNITEALTYNPDVIIINLPSNDVYRATLTPAGNPSEYWDGYTINESMNNYRTIMSVGQAAGAKVYFTTTQPRLLANNWQDSLNATKDSLFSYFGTSRVIDFWTPLVVGGGNYNMLPAVNSGDNLHINNLGHRLVYQNVIAQNVFSSGYIFLPVQLTSFTAKSADNSVKLAWSTADEDPNTTFYVERSTNGVAYSVINTVTGKGQQRNNYTFTDYTPAKGNSFYRIRVAENNREIYSKTVAINFSVVGVSLYKVYTTGSNLYFSANAEKQQATELRIINAAGEVILKKPLAIIEGNKQYSVPVKQLSAGVYYLSLFADNKVTTVAFIN